MYICDNEGPLTDDTVTGQDKYSSRLPVNFTGNLHTSESQTQMVCFCSNCARRVWYSATHLSPQTLCCPSHTSDPDIVDQVSCRCPFSQGPGAPALFAQDVPRDAQTNACVCPASLSIQLLHSCASAVFIYLMSSSLTYGINRINVCGAETIH